MADSSCALSSCVPPLSFLSSMLLPALEGGSERVEPALPQRAILIDPCIQFLEGLRSERIETPLPFRPDPDEPRLFQDAQVPRHAGLMDGHLRHEVVDRLLPREQRLDDLKAA